MTDQEMSTEERAARMLVDDLPDLAKRLHESEPTPAGLSGLSPDRELWAWMLPDPTVDVEGLRARGVPDPEIADSYFPLRKRLRQQAGLTYAEQQAYADRMQQRAMKAAERGSFGKPPERPTPPAGGLGNG
jgi:hypothetical protein